MENVELIVGYAQLKKDIIEVINGYTKSGMPIFISKKALEEVMIAISNASDSEYKFAMDKYAESTKVEEIKDSETE